MKQVEFAGIEWNVEYACREDFLQKYYLSANTEKQTVEKYKGGPIYIIFADELGIPYHFEASKIINKLTGGKLTSKQYKSQTIHEKISEALARREFLLNVDEKIADFDVHIKKAIAETGYQK